MDRRVPPPFPNTPDYVNHSSKALEYLNQPGKTLPKELVSPRYRAYPPLEMFSFPQSPINQDGPPSQQQQPIPSQRSRPGFLRRADSLVSSTELALFRRVHEAQQEALQESQYRQQVSTTKQVMLIFHKWMWFSLSCTLLKCKVNHRNVFLSNTIYSLRPKIGFC